MPVTDAESFWIHIRLGDGELTPRGPFCSEDEAEAASARMGAVCRGILRQPVQIDIRRGQPADRSADPPAMKKRA